MKYFLISEDKTSITAMRLAGVEGILAENSQEAENAMDAAIARKDVAVILVTAGVQEMIPSVVERLKIAGQKPLLAVIPSSDGKGLPKGYIMSLIRESIGVKL